MRRAGRVVMFSGAGVTGEWLYVAAANSGPLQKQQAHFTESSL